MKTGSRVATALRDPFVASVGILVVLAVTGLVGVAVAWKGAAATLVVALQLPYLVSGAIGGLALLGFALGLLLVQTRRRREARERAELDRVVRAAADLLAAARVTR
ncbi:MAG: hypothetical protein QOG87_3445 [Actinomycetota bacterium]|jgi:hypothetical protein